MFETWLSIRICNEPHQRTITLLIVVESFGGLGLSNWINSFPIFFCLGIAEFPENFQFQKLFFAFFIHNLV